MLMVALLGRLHRVIVSVRFRKLSGSEWSGGASRSGSTTEDNG